jgi:ferredoxin-NADP reductase
VATRGSNSDIGVTDAGTRLGWRTGELREKAAETADAATLVFDLEGWPGHRAGQHVDVRLTADDGYQAQRSYSIASAPEDRALALTVERLDEGEVSPYLVDEMRPGDLLEVRGPIGGWFVWEVGDGGPLLLIGGGSGLVPLMAMLRHRARAHSEVPARVLLSARTIDDVLYRDELESLARGARGPGVFTALTREAPPAWTGFDRRVDREMLLEVSFEVRELPRVFVCGPTSFVEAVAGTLVDLGHDPALVKTERFGPTGGPDR